jgi:hypothetical protein
MWSVVLLAVLVLVSVSAHVPTYDKACDQGCCTPPHHHDLSQVIYLRGSGGLELHVDDLDVAGGEVLDVDAVFRDETDNTTYALYIGCGGCVEDDPILAPRVHVPHYEPAEVEPFTQTAYRSIFKKADRKFDTSALAGCSSKHFTIRLVQFSNASKDIVWAPVIGLGEWFTFRELAEFPLYILANHGYAWTRLDWTWWFIVACAVLGWRGYVVWEAVDGRPLWRLGAVRTVYYEYVPRFGIYQRVVLPVGTERVSIKDWRAILYSLAIASFAAAACEEFLHLVFVQVYASFGYGFWVGLIGVIGVGQLFPLALTQLIWSSMLDVEPFLPNPRNSSLWETLRFAWWARWSPWFAILEMATGFSFLFLFGAGFFLGPTCLMLAGLIRLGELANPASTYLPQRGPAEGAGGGVTFAIALVSSGDDDAQTKDKAAAPAAPEEKVPMGRPIEPEKQEDKSFRDRLKDPDAGFLFGLADEAPAAAAEDGAAAALERRAAAQRKEVAPQGWWRTFSPFTLNAGAKAGQDGSHRPLLSLKR